MKIAQSLYFQGVQGKKKSDYFLFLARFTYIFCIFIILLRKFYTDFILFYQSCFSITARFLIEFSTELHQQFFVAH